MITPEFCQLMAKYNQWMNEKVFDAAAKLSDVERKENKNAFFKSIHGTLNHIYYGDIAWLARFAASPEVPKPPQDNQLYFEDFSEFADQRRKLDTKIIDWAATVNTEWLKTEYGFYSYFYKKELKKPYWVFAAHFFNHQTHHRGQLTTLLTQAGVDTGVTDLPWMP